MSALDNTVTPQGPATPKGPVGGAPGSGSGGIVPFLK
jgi:putative multiple sugar transport system permease protein